MSSINKSGKRFTPKVKQRARRVPGLTTPVSSQTIKSSQPQPQTPINSQQQNSSNTPLSPISQNVTSLVDNVFPRTSKEIESDGENEKLSDVDELKEDTPDSNKSTAPVFKQLKFKDTSSTATNLSTTKPVLTEPIPTVSVIPTLSKPSERKTNSTSTNTFTHATSSTMPRPRLNSLSIPTQLTNPRASVTNTSLGTALTTPNNPQGGSRRGSFVIPVGSSRRGSINTGIGIGIGPITISKNVSASRRGSMNSGLKPSTIENVGGGITRHGSIGERLNSLNDDDAVGINIPIPLMKPNKKRRISVSKGNSLRNKDVSVGGISVPISISNTTASSIKKVSISKEKDSSKANEAKVTEERDTDAILRVEKGGVNEDESVRMNKLTDMEKDKSKDSEQTVEKEVEAQISAVDSPEAISKPHQPQKTKKKMEVTEIEKERNEKWVYNNERKKFELITVTNLENDPIKQEQYEFEHEVTSLSELTDLKKTHYSKLGNNLKLNPSKIKMSELCKPFIGIGEISQNYEKALEGERKLHEARLKRRMIRENARKLRMSEENVIKLTESEDFGNFEMDEKRRMEKVKEIMEKDLSNANKQHTVPLLQIQDGKVTYSHESTVIDRHKDDDNVEMEKIEENPFENIVTSNSYSKKKFTLKWTPQEVAELLRGISLWGTDFGIIAQLFPHRTRKQVKAKFLLIEKQTPHLVEFALLRKLPADVAEYSGKTGTSFKSIDEYNKEIEELKLKHEEELKMMETAREQAHAEDRATQQTIYNGGIYNMPTRRSRKAVIAEFRKNEEIVGSIDT